MKDIRKKPAFRLAFCAVIAALEVVMMLASGFVRIGTYALPCLAGMLSVAVVIEYKCRRAFGVFGVAAVLAFFLSGDKEAALLFAALFGYYPILKNILERHIRNLIACWIVKYLIFNAAAVGSFFIAKLLLAVPDSEFTLFGVYVPFVFLAAGNVFFLLYDLSVSVFVRFYAQNLRNRIFRD